MFYRKLIVSSFGDFVRRGKKNKPKLLEVTLPEPTRKECLTRKLSAPLTDQLLGIRKLVTAHQRRSTLARVPKTILISRCIIRIDQEIERILWVFMYSTSPGLHPKRILSSSMDLMELVVGVGRGIETSNYSGLESGYRKKPISRPPGFGHFGTTLKSRQQEKTEIS